MVESPRSCVTPGLMAALQALPAAASPHVVHPPNTGLENATLNRLNVL